MNQNHALLEVSKLATSFYTPYGEVKAVNGVSFHVQEGETLGLIGESGSGKSVTALSIMRVIPRGGRIIGGEVKLQGSDLLNLSEQDMTRFRGKVLSMIFQNPRATLDPYFKIKAQAIEQIITHSDNLSSAVAENEVLRTLSAVGIRSPRELMASYPSELSAGMCQRIMIAIALLCKPKMVIADEPTSNLDSLSQYKILTILKKLKEMENLSMIFITHDFHVVSFIADRIAVMYGGKIMEMARKDIILRNPIHPYTRGLINSVVIDLSAKTNRLYQIEGEPPDNINPPLDCRFSARCSMVREICKEQDPDLQEVEAGHYVRCHFAR